MSRQPFRIRLAKRLFMLIAPGDAAEFVLGDLDEQAAAKLREGASRHNVRAWHLRQLILSLPPLWADRLRGNAFTRTRPETAGNISIASRVLRDAALNLKRSPGRSFAVISMMALGVGANATMFGALDRLFLKPPAHVSAPDDVKRFFVNIRRTGAPEIVTQTWHTYPDYADWRTLDVFEATAAYGRRYLTVGTGEDAERIPVTLATASFFDLLDVSPVLGRFFNSEDDTFGAVPVAVLGHSYWQRKFGRSPDVIGQTVHVGDQRYTIIGVAPAGFTGVDLSSVDVWLPLHPAGVAEEGGTDWLDSRGWYWIQAIARLAPGVAPEAAATAATGAHRNGRREDARYVARGPSVEMASLILARTSKASAVAKVVPWVMGVALLVLLLTCANVANLLLAGGLRQRRATAVKTALGATRSRLLATGVAETMLMTLFGGLAATVVTVWGGDVFRTTLFPGVEWVDGSDTMRVVVFSTLLALSAGLITGLVSATRSSHHEPATALTGGGRSMTRARSRLRSSLLVAQAAISLVLLVGTGLFVLSLNKARRVDLGFNPDPVLLVTLQPEGGYPGGEAMIDLYRSAVRTLHELPGDVPIAISTTVPFQNSRSIGEDLRVPGLDSLPSTRSGGAYIHAVSGDYFAASGLEIVQGRAITQRDDAPTAPRVAVVNETMAGLVWPNGDALGSCMILRDAPCATVVGIARDSRRFGIDEDDSMNYYVPLAHSPRPWPPRGILIRTENPRGLAPTVQRLINERMSGVRRVGTIPYRNVIDPTYRSWQLGAVLFAGFGMLALVVASIGLYSVLAFDVAERRREIGLRSALGATQGRIMRFVVGSGLRLAGVGILIGLAIGYLAAPFARDLLFEVSPREPLVLATCALVMLVVSTFASWLPAWRAARVAPNETLRAE